MVTTANHDFRYRSRRYGLSWDRKLQLIRSRRLGTHVALRGKPLICVHLPNHRADYRLLCFIHRIPGSEQRGIRVRESKLVS